MSARDDYLELFRLASGFGVTYLEDAEGQAGKALIEIDRLRAWKAEAMQVLGEWDEVWEAAGRPGPLGSSKARAVAARYRRPNQEQVDKYGRLFARIMDKRDGIGTQEAVDEAVDEVMTPCPCACHRGTYTNIPAITNDCPCCRWEVEP